MDDQVRRKISVAFSGSYERRTVHTPYISIYSPFDEVDAITTSRTLTTRSPRTGTENLNERGYVPKGTSIKVYGQCKGYYRINWENNTFDDGLGHGNGYIAKDDISIPVTEISVSSSDIIIRKGDSKKITATVAPTRATDKTLNWKSSSKKTASVDQNGNIKGVEKGTAKITANTGNKTASCMVSVYEEIKENTGKVKGYTREGCNIYKGAYNSGIVRTAAKHENLIIEGDAGSYYYVIADKDKASGFIEKSKIEIPVVKIVINSKKSEIKKGHKLKLTKTLFPTITTQTKGIWSSSNKSIAAVSQTGVLTPVKEGTFTVSYTINRKIGGKKKGKKKYNIVAPKRIGFTNHRNIPENKKLDTKMQGLTGIGKTIFFIRVKKNGKKDQYAKLYMCEIVKNNGKYKVLKEWKFFSNKYLAHANCMAAVKEKGRIALYVAPCQKNKRFIYRVYVSLKKEKGTNKKTGTLSRRIDTLKLKDSIMANNKIFKKSKVNKINSIAVWKNNKKLYLILNCIQKDMKNMNYVFELKGRRLYCQYSLITGNPYDRDGNTTSQQGATFVGNDMNYYLVASHAHKKKNLDKEVFESIWNNSYVFKYKLTIKNSRMKAKSTASYRITAKKKVNWKRYWIKKWKQKWGKQWKKKVQQKYTERFEMEDLYIYKKRIFFNSEGGKQCLDFVGSF